MMQEGQIERIALATLRKNERLSTVKKNMEAGVLYLEEKGVTEPNDTDFKDVEAHFHAEGRKRSAADIRRATERYYEYQKGEKQMSFEFEETAQQAEIEPVSSEGVAVSEVSAPTEIEGVSEAIGTDHGADVEGATTGRENTGSLSVATVESNEALPVQQANTAPKPKNKGGRKILDPNGEKRSEKVMIYLRPSLYADVKDWANLHGKTITDCIVGMIEVYMQGKQEKLALFRELRDNE